ncbi:MAG TPA: alpha/beta fold hydrolase [Bacilli bacterium]
MWRFLFGTLFIITAAVISLIVGVVTILAVAIATTKPVLFVSAGALAYIIVFALTMKWFVGRAKSRIYFTVCAYSIGLLFFAAIAITLLKPLDIPQYHSDSLKKQYWDLPTGSSIAYVHLPGIGVKKPEPIIFLHGGPGTPDMEGDARYFNKLTEDGYDVYIYDELGTGHSMRLNDPRGYGIKRDVADLEAIRNKIGIDRMILIGHSYGGEIAADYLVHYGQHVSKAVFSSPGPIDPSDHSDTQLIARLSNSERWKLYGHLMYPRSLMAYLLLQVNPLAAHTFAGDEEMDAEFDRIYAITEPALHAEGKHYDLPLHHLGFYANQMPQSRMAAPKPDLRVPLSAWDGPALILKGSDDYLSWASAMDYRNALRNSQLIYLEQAGHNEYQDQPELVMNIIRSFLADRPLPVSAYNEDTPPPTFQR